MELVSLTHSVLRRRTMPVGRPYALDTIVKQMWDVMYKSGGVGLAAPQVGIPLAVAVIDCEGWKDVLVNPRVIKRDGKRLCYEGCLSLPGGRYAVRRAKGVTVEYETVDGTTKTVKARKSVLAQCLEHETDHLRGVLIDGRKPTEVAL